MLVFYLKKMAVHFLAYSILLGLLIAAPTIMTTVLVGLGSYIMSCLLLISLISPSLYSSIPFWLSVPLSVFASSLLIPTIHPCIRPSLLPGLVTPIGFIVIMLMLVSITAEFITLGPTYSPLRLIFSPKTRKELIRDYQHDTLSPSSRQRTVDMPRALQMPPATQNAITLLAPRPPATRSTLRVHTASAAISRQSGSQLPPGFNPNPRKLSDITLSPEEEKTLFQKQLTALKDLDKLVTAQQEGTYAFTDTQMDLYRKFLSLETNDLQCKLTLLSYDELNGTRGFLYKERYQERSKTWEIEPGFTHFFSVTSDCGLKSYFDRAKPNDVIKHPVLQELIVSTAPAYTRYRFHPTKTLGEYKREYTRQYDKTYQSEPYQYYLNTDVFYYAKEIVASGSELNNSNSLQFSY